MTCWYSTKACSELKLFGADWGAGTFKYKACDFCDDVFAETADVLLGDAWLPEYVQDSYCTNIVVTRNQDIRQLIVNARTEGRLEMDNLGIEKGRAVSGCGVAAQEEEDSRSVEF